MSQHPAAQQADSGATPDGAETGRAAIENQLAEDREQDLRRPAASGPADVDQRESENQRSGAHIAQPLLVLVPRPHHLGFGERAARRARSRGPPETAGRCTARKPERKASCRTNAHWYPNCITLAPPRKVPMVSVVHCVVWVSELAVCSSSLVAMDGRIEARPLVKNGEASISSALSTYSSHVSVRLHRQDERHGHHGADQVARDHDLLAVQPVEHHARHRPDQHRRDGAREHHAAHHQPGIGVRHRQAEDGDVVEVVADFADHLAGPGVAIVAVVPQQRDEGVQPMDSSRTVIARM